MLRWRLTLGILLIAILAGLCWIDHAAERRGIVLLPVVMGIGVLATGEMLAMFRRSGRQFPAIPVYAAVLLAIAATGVPVFLPTLGDPSSGGPSSGGPSSIGRAGWLSVGLTAGFLLLLVSGMWRYRPQSESIPPREHTAQIAHSVLAVCYIGGLLGFLFLLRTLPSGESDHDLGLLALVSLIVVVKSGDTGAYTFGRLFGRHKMAPSLSPGKTWEGTIGGLVCSCLGAWWIIAVVPGWLGWTSWIGRAGGESAAPLSICVVYGMAVGAAGIIGDLAESLFKRDAGVKDSSQWMPGFGGILDLLDSLLVAAPVAYLIWVFALLGP